MSDAAARLRAQKAYSTDPEYLERMALEADARRARDPDVGVGHHAARGTTKAVGSPDGGREVIERVHR